MSALVNRMTTRRRGKTEPSQGNTSDRECQIWGATLLRLELSHVVRARITARSAARGWQRPFAPGKDWSVGLTAAAARHREAFPVEQNSNEFEYLQLFSTQYIHTGTRAPKSKKGLNVLA